MPNRWQVIEVVIVAVVLYVAVSMTAYKFSHSDLTQTELILNTFDALFWRW